jgi:predicted nucleic acid-binding protein
VPPAVYDELIEAIRFGCQFLQPAAQLIDQGRLRIIPLTAREIVAKPKLPASFGAGDSDCVIIAQHRKWPILTNDRRVRNFCREQGLTVFDLPQLLRALWENGILSRTRTHRLVGEIELGENMVIRNKDAIFESISKRKAKTLIGGRRAQWRGPPGPAWAMTRRLRKIGCTTLTRYERHHAVTADIFARYSQRMNERWPTGTLNGERIPLGRCG